MLPDDIHAPPPGGALAGKSHNTPTFSAQRAKGPAGKMFPPNEPSNGKSTAAAQPTAAPAQPASAGMMTLKVPTIDTTAISKKKTKKK